MDNRRETIPIYCFTAGEGNLLAAIKISEALCKQGIPVSTDFYPTLSTLFASYQHRRITRSPKLTEEYTNGGSLKSRGGVTALAHSLNVIQTIITRNPHLLKKNPDRKSVWVQELGLSLLTYFPQLADHLFGEIFLACPDTYGKTTGRFSAYAVAKKVGATVLYPYKGGYDQALANGVKADWVEPYLPGSSLQETEKLLQNPVHLGLRDHVIKESGSSMPPIWKEKLVRMPREGQLLPMSSVVTPTRIEEYCGQNMVYSHKRPSRTKLYSAFANPEIQQFTTYATEMAMLLLTLGYLGEKRKVRLLPARGPWEEKNRDVLVQTLGSMWAITALCWDQASQEFAENRLYPVPGQEISIKDVMSTQPISQAILR